jgi:large subunit ribosomal protein L29
MKTSVIQEFSISEINERLEEEKNQFIKLKLNHAVSPLENPMKIKAYRKNIAQLKTELRARELNNNKKNIQNGK